MRPSLRNRVYAASGLFIGLQVVGTVLGFASWAETRSAGAVEEAIAEERAGLMALSSVTRELYVHQAHTLIERGPGHLDHLSETQMEVDTQLATVRGFALPPEADIDAVQSAIAASNTWFTTEVVPMARGGRIDQAEAVRLHGEAERQSAEIEAKIAGVSTVLDAAQARERAAIAAATKRAWIALACLTVGGALLGVVVAGRLVRSILAPVEALRSAAVAFGGGRKVSGAPEGDDEIGELGRVFNRMVGEVRDAERRLVESERLAALGEMSGAVAHELMNPLAVILADPAMRSPDVAASRAEAEHARRVVHGLLGFARPGEEPAVVVDLVEAASAAAIRLSPAADLRDVRITVEAEAPATTVASPSAVRQVLDNLVRNAIEAAPEGSTVQVVVTSGPSIEVRDEGAGIPAAIRSRLYEPFVTGRAEGTGLGLAVCQRIARAHGGGLEHRPRVPRGTVAVWTVGGAYV